MKNFSPMTVFVLLLARSKHDFINQQLFSFASSVALSFAGLRRWRTWSVPGKLLTADGRWNVGKFIHNVKTTIQLFVNMRTAPPQNEQINEFCNFSSSIANSKWGNVPRWKGQNGKFLFPSRKTKQSKWNRIWISRQMLRGYSTLDNRSMWSVISSWFANVNDVNDINFCWLPLAISAADVIFLKVHSQLWIH